MSALSNKLREAAERADRLRATAPAIRRDFYASAADLHREAANRIDQLEKPEEKNGEVCAWCDEPAVRQATTLGGTVYYPSCGKHGAIT